MAKALRRTQGHWLILGLGGASIVLALLLRFAVEPDPRGHGTHEQLGLPACNFMKWTGIPCPGCGVTTSVALALRCELRSSVSNQPVGLFAAAMLVLFPLAAFAAHLAGRDLGRDARRLRPIPLVVAAVAVALVSWIYKIALVRGWL